MKYMPHALAILALILTIVFICTFTSSQAEATNACNSHERINSFSEQVDDIRR